MKINSSIFYKLLCNNQKLLVWLKVSRQQRIIIRKRFRSFRNALEEIIYWCRYIYVRDLLSMVMKYAATGRSKTDLPALYDELESKIRALESLGRTQEKYRDFLNPLVES
ncbi:hypothetical protein AVEN_118589-1 [Araneus ventricosus]|uniref:Uncharacterized protein n=1 Tax=Araneus ventricosus TaxID=182803 RepID=A0A4Y2AYM6_ARAVE|nr:hypothetical protein AVEN_118589-1 [Araneus ventricosus]